MLRITQTETETEQKWMLCGRLAGPSVAVLRACWEHDHRGADSVRRRVLDLSDVTFIDESGERLLAEMRGGGARLVAAGVATRHLLENLVAPESASNVTVYRPGQRHSGKSRVIKTGETSEESA
jgi:hypothetical protein